MPHWRVAWEVSVTSLYGLGSSDKPVVKKVKYDAHDQEVEFEFKTRVEWKSPKVTITKGNRNYVVKIKEKDNDEIEVRVKWLQAGRKYSYRITGVRIAGNAGYQTVTGTFTAGENRGRLHPVALPYNAGGFCGRILENFVRIAHLNF